MGYKNGIMQPNNYKMILKICSATNIYVVIFLVEVDKMKFCDKIVKLRKDRNLSQEQLAEKLNVSRQAVSKWESGISYPDMNKMLSICKILDCKLDELIDDGALGENVDKPSNIKFDLMDNLKDFLGYITNIYNMFYSMTFKEKIKCVFEMFFISIILMTVSLILLFISEGIINSIFNLFPYNVFFEKLKMFFTTLILIVLFLVDAIVFFHLFKIRYLDYYVTIVDKTVSEKTIEIPVNKNDARKIIIRDPKHSSQKFFEAFYKMIIFFVKVITLFLTLPFICLFLLGVFIFSISIYNGFVYNDIFFYIGICCIGLCLAFYIIIEMSYKFIFNIKQRLAILFYIGAIGVFVAGVGAGLTFTRYMSLNFTNPKQIMLSKVEYVEDIDKKFYFNSLQPEFIEDEEVEGVKVEFNYPQGLEIYLNDSEDQCVMGYYRKSYQGNGFQVYKEVMNEIKENKMLIFEELTEYANIKVYAKKDTLKRIVKGYEK